MGKCVSVCVNLQVRAGHVTDRLSDELIAEQRVLGGPGQGVDGDDRRLDTQVPLFAVPRAVVVDDQAEQGLAVALQGDSVPFARRSLVVPDRDLVTDGRRDECMLCAGELPDDSGDAMGEFIALACRSPSAFTPPATRSVPRPGATGRSVQQ